VRRPGVWACLLVDVGMSSISDDSRGGAESEWFKSRISIPIEVTVAETQLKSVDRPPLPAPIPNMRRK